MIYAEEQRAPPVLGTVLLGDFSEQAREVAADTGLDLIARKTQVVCAPIVERSDEPPFFVAEAETKLAKARMRFSFVVSPEELQSVHGVAIAVLIRSGDDAIAQTVSVPTPGDPIVRPMPVPDDLRWRIHLLMDRILIWRDES